MGGEDTILVTDKYRNRLETGGDRRIGGINSETSNSEVRMPQSFLLISNLKSYSAT